MKLEVDITKYRMDGKKKVSVEYCRTEWADDILLEELLHKYYSEYYGEGIEVAIR